MRVVVRINMGPVYPEIGQDGYVVQCGIAEVPVAQSLDADRIRWKGLYDFGDFSIDKEVPSAAKSERW